MSTNKRYLTFQWTNVHDDSPEKANTVEQYLSSLIKRVSIKSGSLKIKLDPTNDNGTQTVFLIDRLFFLKDTIIRRKFADGSIHFSFSAAEEVIPEIINMQALEWYTSPDECDGSQIMDLFNACLDAIYDM